MPAHLSTCYMRALLCLPASLGFDEIHQCGVEPWKANGRASRAAYDSIERLIQLLPGPPLSPNQRRSLAVISSPLRINRRSRHDAFDVWLTRIPAFWLATQHAEGNIRYRNREARDDRDSRSARYFAEQDSYPSRSTSVEPVFNSSVPKVLNGCLQHISGTIE
jgi:hypothetical protein